LIAAFAPAAAVIINKVGVLPAAALADSNIPTKPNKEQIKNEKTNNNLVADYRFGNGDFRAIERRAGNLENSFEP
jgi:hypothetical protein